jgi:hypothetical protein
MTSINKTLLDIDKIKIIDTIIEHYPELKKDRSNIINIILEKTERLDRLILDKVIINNKNYYRDKDNILVDINLQIVGVVQVLSDNSTKFIIRREPNRKKIYESFLAEQDFKIKQKNKV